MQIGDKLPEFNLKSVNGNMYNQYMYADKYALAVVFTCNSCETSKAYGQRLIKLLQKFEEDNLGIIGINSNNPAISAEDSFDEMVRISEKLHLNELHFSYLQDPEHTAADAFGAKINPEVFLFNSKRELVYRGAIDDCPENEHMVTQAWLEEAIDSALDGIEVDFPEIEPVGCPIIR